MYKQIILILIIFFLIIAFDTLLQKNTEKTVNNINQNLHYLRKEIKSDTPDYENIKKDIDEIMKLWREEYKKLAYYIEHNELEKVETELTKLRADIEMKEYDAGIENLDNGIFILNHIKDKNSLKIVNIF